MLRPTDRRRFGSRGLPGSSTHINNGISSGRQNIFKAPTCTNLKGVCCHEMDEENAHPPEDLRPPATPATGHLIPAVSLKTTSWTFHSCLPLHPSTFNRWVSGF